MPIRGPSDPLPPARRARTAVASLPAGRSTSKPWPARSSATHPAARCSSKAGSGLAWMRCDRSRISSRAASTASAAAALMSANGSAGRASIRAGIGLLAFRGERELRDDEDGGEEQQDRELERVDEPEDDHDRGEQADPRATSRRPGPVALVGDPSMPREDDEPPERGREE